MLNESESSIRSRLNTFKNILKLNTGEYAYVFTLEELFLEVINNGINPEIGRNYE